MKKVLSLVLAAAFVLSLTIGVGVFSASATNLDTVEKTPWIGADSAQAYPGDVCTPMCIRVFNNPGISHLRLRITFPEKIVHLLEIKERDFIGLTMEPLEEGSYQQGFYLVWDSSDGQDVASDGVLAELLFEAAADNDVMDQVTVRLWCESGNATNANGDTVDFASKHSYIAIPLYRMGDINYDQKINNHDLAAFQRYLNDESHPILKETADVNNDGSINNRDLSLLQQYLNEWDVELFNPYKNFDGTITDETATP